MNILLFCIIPLSQAWTWGFSPSSEDGPHPLFPRDIGQLNMYADYRVPQVLHPFRQPIFKPALVYTGSGTRKEISNRAGWIIAVDSIAAALRMDGLVRAMS